MQNRLGVKLSTTLHENPLTAETIAATPSMVKLWPLFSIGKSKVRRVRRRRRRNTYFLPVAN